MKILLKFSIILTIAILISGCGKKIVYVDRPVYVNVPQLCQAADINCSFKGKNSGEKIVELLTCNSRLRAGFDECRGKN